MDLITNNANDKYTLRVQLGLSALFDIVDVTLLLGDLQRFGIVGNVYIWVLKYIKQRQFQVFKNKSYSQVGHMKTAAPRGRKQGPVLFAIYTANLHYLPTTRKFT